MILLTGLDSVIESIYLEEKLTDLNRSTNILINPIDVTYVSGRIVIINHKSYPVHKLMKLIENKNEVYSRVNFNIEGINFKPYILRINDSIIPSGEIIDISSEDLYDKVDHKFKNGILYYPTPKYYYDYHLDGNLTVLGYLLYQIGINLEILDDSIQKDLNIIKLKNGLII
jgi:hypothetical protein